MAEGVRVENIGRWTSWTPQLERGYVTSMFVYVCMFAPEYAWAGGLARLFDPNGPPTLVVLPFQIIFNIIIFIKNFLSTALVSS